MNKIASLNAETTRDIIGIKINAKSTIQNGKGMRQETDIQGSALITCYNDKVCRSTNPMMLSGSSEPMPEKQYIAGTNIS